MKNNLYVDDRKNRPYHCDLCGDCFYPCKHWDKPKVDESLCCQETQKVGVTKKKTYKGA
jgi:hypothetical protein